ncbi:MAG: hypothetical protein GX639_19565 [Fibrobacter sp.]|nr:hypothetical protein [Fibrobacter sp.]
MRNNRGSSLIFVVSLAIILNIVFITVYMTVSKTQKATGSKRLKTSSVTIAEAGKEKLYAQLIDKSYTPTANQRVTVYTDFALGAGTFTVSCSANVTLDTVWIESWGKDSQSETGIAIVAALSPRFVFNGVPVRGAITARTNVQVLGNITVDGRDHDTNGVLTGDPGLYGVSTCDALVQSGNAHIGGYGQEPLRSSDTTGKLGTIAEQEVPVNAALASPEAFLGLAPGALDEYKSTTLSTPFHGIRYITGNVGPVDFGDEKKGEYSSGILIVHNYFKTAEMKLNQGKFIGLIIIDKMDNINGVANILGSVVTLGETEVNTFGSGGATINYSSYVMNNLGKYCENIKNRVTEVSWKELKR